MKTVDEIRPLTAGCLLSIRREVCTDTEDELERGALCNARVLASCCFCDGEPVFANAQEVLEALTFREMEDLLRRWKDGEQVRTITVNPCFDEARYAHLRER